MSKKVGNNKKNSQQISEEAIRKRAYELWKTEGEGSNGQDNWNKAKLQLEQEQEKAQALKGLRKIAFQINQPLILLEKRVFEPCAEWFERAAFFQIIEKLSPLFEAIGVLLIPVAIWWFTENGNQAKEQQEKAARGHQAVQNYLNQLSNILLQGGVKEIEKNEELRNIIRASTLSLLENPDLQNNLKKQNFEEDRKGQIIRYLSETQLIQSSKTKDKQKFSAISLDSANLKGAKLEGANLVGASLESADLEIANLVGARLEGANLVGAELEGAELWMAKLKGARLERARLERADLMLAYLEGANLEGANLVRANLVRTNLVGANLEQADLEQADLEVAKLEGANLVGANLKKANLKSTNLVRAKYTNVDTNPRVCEHLTLKAPCPTQFPQGFDPITAKMVLIKNLDDIK